MSIADDIMEQAKAHAEVYRAGMAAADANSPSARKLARLCERLDEMLSEMKGGEASFYWRTRLQFALAEARRP